MRGYFKIVPAVFSMSCFYFTTTIFFLSSSAFAQSLPQPVPYLAERQLDKVAYVELAKQWKAYIEKHGESAYALVNLAMAYRYSGEKEAELVAAERAVEIAPNNPDALYTLGNALPGRENDSRDRAIHILKRCLEIAPNHGEGLKTLIAHYMAEGALEKADSLFVDMFRQNILDRPLQDFGYNLLAGLPEGAVLVTNGDNDTFPPLALQNGMSFRNDVILINHSLFNLEKYAEAVFNRHPGLRVKFVEKPKDGLVPSAAMLEKIVRQAKVPVYFASTVYFGPDRYEPEMVIEGLNRRAVGKDAGREESARLFIETYRLDSAMDWTYPWDLKPNYARLMRNYVWSMITQAEEDNLSENTRSRLVEKVRGIAGFHKMKDAELKISTMQKR